MKFKKLNIEDKEIFQKYVGTYEFGTYEYSFLTLYIWRKMLNVEIGIIEDSLIIKKQEQQKGSYFMQPMGYEKKNLKEIVYKLNEITKRDKSFKNLFRDIEFPFLYELMDLYKGNVCLCEDINNFDYIYKSEDLISLSGHKFHRKKNLYNQFIGNYNYKIKDICQDNVVRDCINFSHMWYEQRQEEDEQLKYELESISEILPNFRTLGFKGMAVYVDNKIAGFTVGEKVNSNMAIIHIEKGDFKYNGIYAFINKAFTERYLSDVKLINRQEDLGIKGLRKAKKSYNPVKLEKKFIVNVDKIDIMC